MSEASSKVGKTEMRGTRYGQILLLALLMVTCSIEPVVALPLNLVETYVDTSGDGRAIAVRGYHVFLADGPRGLKIFNLSYPPAPSLTGRVSIPSGVVEDVAVEGDTVVLTDPTNQRVHFVDVWDLMRPRVEATFAATGDVPRRVALAGNRAFVAERGEDQGASGYFSGMEVIVHRGSPLARQRHLIPIEGINDVLVPRHRLYPYVLVAAGNEILVFKQTVTESDPQPLGRVELAEGEDIQSLAFHDDFIFAFGIQGLYVAGPVPKVFPQLNIAFESLLEGSLGIPGKFSKQPASTTEPTFARLAILAKATVEGPLENRRVDAAVLPLRTETTPNRRAMSRLPRGLLLSDEMTTEPRVVLLLTTATSYGLYVYDPVNQDLLPFNMGQYMRDSAEAYVMREVPARAQGELTIFDSGFANDFGPGFFRGGVMGVGAIGKYGLGYVYVEP